MSYYSNNSGQSIIEIVIALALFIIIASSLAIAVIGSFSGLERGRDFIRAGALAQEGIEAVRAIRDRDFSEIIYNRSAVATSSSQWIFLGEGTTETIGGFARAIDFYPVYRDGSGNLVQAGDPGAAIDASSARVSVNISWEIMPGVNDTIERMTYLTDWRE